MFPSHNEKLSDHSRSFSNVFLNQLRNRTSNEGAVGMMSHYPLVELFRDSQKSSGCLIGNSMTCRSEENTTGFSDSDSKLDQNVNDTRKPRSDFSNINQI